MLGLILPLATRLVGERFAKAASWAFVALVGAALIGGVVWWFNDTVEDARSDGVKSGVTAERAATQGKVIENVKAAKDAGEAVRRDGVPPADCLRDSRRPENC